MAQDRSASTYESADALPPSSPLGHRLMFLGLIVLAFCLFAPTTLLPVLREHCELLAEEDRLRERIGVLEEQVAHSSELVYAFENDMVINERLAVLDLRYRKPNEVVVPVLPSRRPQPAEEQNRLVPGRNELVLPEAWPAWALSSERWARKYGLIELFLDPSLRPVFLLMSAGIMIAAFVLFAPRKRTIVLPEPLALNR